MMKRDLKEEIHKQIAENELTSHLVSFREQMGKTSLLLELFLDKLVYPSTQYSCGGYIVWITPFPVQLDYIVKDEQLNPRIFYWHVLQRIENMPTRHWLYFVFISLINLLVIFLINHWRTFFFTVSFSFDILRHRLWLWASWTFLRCSDRLWTKWLIIKITVSWVVCWCVLAYS